MNKKEAYEKKLRAQLDEWRAEIDKFQARVDKARADAEIDYQQELEELRDRQRDMEDRLEEMRGAGEGAWDDIRQGADRAWRNMESAFESALARFR